MFKKYMHLERLGMDEVDEITLGEVYVFPKLDGTNASVWLNSDGSIGVGARNRELSYEKDNAGFYKWVLKNESKFKSYFEDKPEHILYGEWLVPHSLKTYREDAWRDFYIFDVCQRDIEKGELKYLPFEYYRDALDKHELTYLTPFAKIKNGTEEDFRSLTEENIFYIKEGEGIGEGIVLKNYDFRNKYGRTIWAKVIANSFKEKGKLKMGGSEHDGLSNEEKIVDDYVTGHLVDKIHAKIVNEQGDWSNKYVPRLLNMVFYDLITEEMWDILKKYKQPKIDFKVFNRLTTQKIKELKPELF